MKLRFLVVWLTVLPLLSSGQLLSRLPDKTSLSGYVKDLRTISYVLLPEDDLSLDNLYHNRLNFKWYASKQFTIAVEARNRLFFGSSVNEIPRYGRLIDDNNDIVDLSFFIADQDRYIIHTVLDRLYIDWSKGDWQVRAGRQRINWGTNLVWNPNDIFNTYSFFDFDYEERPGSDAVRIQRYMGVAGRVELSVKTVGDIEDFVGAFLWQFNKWNYDVQLFSGVFGDDVVFGTGWAGNIKNAGFRGEASYFLPFRNTEENDHSLAVSVSSDYAFKNGLFLNGSFLYNSAGQTSPDLLSITFFDLSAKNLSPYKYSFFVQTAYPVTPLLNASFATIYSPGDHALFLNPGFTFSVAENVDLDMLAQIFFTRIFDEYKAFNQLYFLRLKWSF